MAMVLAGLLTMAMMPSAEAPDCWAARMELTVSSSAPAATAANASRATPRRGPTTARFIAETPTFPLMHLESSPLAPRREAHFLPGGRTATWVETTSPARDSMGMSSSRKAPGRTEARRPDVGLPHRRDHPCYTLRWRSGYGSNLEVGISFEPSRLGLAKWTGSSWRGQTDEEGSRSVDRPSAGRDRGGFESRRGDTSDRIRRRQAAWQARRRAFDVPIRTPARYGRRQPSEEVHGRA